MNYLRLNLKVCEACGTLWLRGPIAEGVYCRGCMRRLAEFPTRREKHAGGRPRRRLRLAGCAVAAATLGGAR